MIAAHSWLTRVSWRWCLGPDRLRRVIAAVLLSLLSLPIAAQVLGPTPTPTAFSPELVADLVGEENNGLPGVTEFDISRVGFRAWFQGLMLFSADDGVHGLELWATDGTAEGTRMVMDICPGVCSSGPTLFQAGGRGIVFQASDGESGFEVWSSDGTREGTWLLADVGPGPAVADHRFSIYPFGDSWLLESTIDEVSTLVLMPDEPRGFRKAVVLKTRDVGPNSRSEGSIPIGDSVLFAWACAEGANQKCLWITDGTTEGTAPWLTESPVEVFSILRRFRWAILGQTLLLSDADACLLAVSLETGTTTSLICDAHATFLTVIGEYVFFLNSASGAQRVWRTDGTVNGTGPVELPDLSEEGIWSLTGAGTRMVLATSSNEFGYRLWSTDGTPEGTELLVDPVSGQEPDDNFWIVLFGLFAPFPGGDVVLATFGDAESQAQVWSTDGTLGGTHKLTGQDAEIGGPSFGVNEWSQSVAGGAPPFRIYPVLPHSSADFGLPTWWATDGTAQGTVSIMEPLRGSSWPQLPHSGPSGDLLYLARTSETFRSHVWEVSVDYSPRKLMGPNSEEVLSAHTRPPVCAVTDEAAFYSTRRDFQEPLKIRTLNEEGVLEVFLEASDDGISEFGDFIYSSKEWLLSTGSAGNGDGGAWRVIDPSTGQSVPTGAVPAQGHSFHQTYEWNGGTLLSADNGLWSLRSSGVAEQFSGEPERTFHFAGGQTLVYFTSSEDRTQGAEHSLWSSDGEVTQELVPFGGEPRFVAWEGREDGAGVSTREWFTQRQHPQSIVTVGDRAFFAAKTAATGIELWTVTPGELPRLVKDLAKGSESGFPRYFFGLGDGIFFVANDGEHGEELWTSDGTTSGTYMVSDLNPGPVGSRPRELVQCGDNLCYSAYRPDVGRELWTLPGSGAVAESLPRLAADVSPGPESSSPSQLFVHDGALYFSANDGVIGFEPWRIRLEKGTVDAIFNDGFESGDLGAWTIVEIRR